MKFKTPLLAGILILSSMYISAQEVWSLQKCIDHALQNNIQIKQQELQTEISRNNSKQSKYNLLPSVGGSLGESINMGRNIDYGTNTYVNKTTNSTSVGVSASATLFNGFKNYHQIKKSELDLLAGIAGLDKIKNDIQLNIASAYLNILYNVELVKVSQDQIATTNLQLDRTNKLVEAGKLPKGDLLKINAQLAQEELQLVSYQNSLESSYLTLSQILELQSPKDFMIEIPEVSVDKQAKDPMTVEASYNVALGVLPEIKQYEAYLKASEKDHKIAFANYFPSLSVSAGFNSGYSSTIGALATPGDINSAFILTPFWDQITNSNYGGYISLSLQIPIFNKFQVRNNVKNSKIRMSQAELNLENTKKNVYKSIQQANADAVAALKKYYATQKSVESLEESFRYSQEKYNVGKLNSIDYNLSKNQLANAQSELLRAKYEYVFKTKILDFYRGNPFSL